MLGFITAIAARIILIHVSTMKTGGKTAWQTNPSFKFCGANIWHAGSLPLNQSIPRKYIWTSFPTGQYSIFWATAPKGPFYWFSSLAWRISKSIKPDSENENDL